MLIDPLDIPIGNIFMNDSKFKGEFPNGTVFDGEGFFNWLNKAKNTHLWVMTYSCSVYCPVFVEVKKLIYNRGEPFAVKHKQRNVHTKLYIQWLRTKVVGVYLGSQNYVAPTCSELMVKLDTKCHVFAVDYFNFYWNLK